MSEKNSLESNVEATNGAKRSFSEFGEPSCCDSSFGKHGETYLPAHGNSWDLDKPKAMWKLEWYGEPNFKFSYVISDPYEKQNTEKPNGVTEATSGGLLSPQPCSALPRINIRCECHDDIVHGSTYLNVIRVEEEDDGSFTAVTDHWPNAKLTNADQKSLEKNQGGPTAFGEATCSDSAITATPVDMTLNSNYIEGYVMLHQILSQRPELKDTLVFVNNAILPPNLPYKVKFSHYPNRIATLASFDYFLANPPQHISDHLSLDEVRNYRDWLYSEQAETRN